MQLTIRPAEVGDAGRIADITVQAYVHGGHLEQDSSYVHTLSDVLPRIGQSYVAVDSSNAVIGAISVFSYGSPHTDIAQRGEAEFRFLAIDPKYWGKGIGGRMISVAEEIAQRDAVDAMVLRVISMNERGKSLYEHLGYVRIPDRDLTLPPHVSACGVTNVTLLALRKELVPKPHGA
jgi:ribosomal protein S18 acetylase RimI-like enzyme